MTITAFLVLSSDEPQPIPWIAMEACLGIIRRNAKAKYMFNIVQEMIAAYT